jgi:hypothetical protein
VRAAEEHIFQQGRYLRWKIVWLGHGSIQFFDPIVIIVASVSLSGTKGGSARGVTGPPLSRCEVTDKRASMAAEDLVLPRLD